MLCRSMGVPQPIVCQPYYNAMDRTPENEILPACGHLGLGVVPYSPLARGVLTGKYKPGEEPSGETRAGRDDKRIMETEFRPESLHIAQKITEHAEAKGMAAGHFAMQWLLNNWLVTSILAGPRNTGQWQGYLDGLEARFDSEDESFVDSLVAPGHPSTPGYSDPRYPPQGRVARSAPPSEIARILFKI
jgi:aryl-alcohol dehydrogenase-like predicted oxidoreductase